MEKDTIGDVGRNTTGNEAGGQVNPPPRSHAAEKERLTGKVVVTGGEAVTFTTLQVAGRAPVRLTGDFEGELRRLSGAVVRVDGTRTERGPGVGLNVHSYEVLSIDGERPRVGTLLMRDGMLWLASSDTMRLAAAPEELRAQAGAKVWIIGQSTGEELQVQSYGVIRNQ